MRNWCSASRATSTSSPLKTRDSPVPIDAVTTSGSGLDPDITPDNAYFQAPLIAKARGLDEPRIRQLIKQHTSGRTLGVLGEPRVNVLELNLALDKSSK